MRIAGSTALVTGAGRGLGATLVEALLARGAATVYAGARDPRDAENKDPRVIPLRLDVTDPASVRGAAERAGDVDLLINNAGIAGNGSLLTGDPERARAELETNFWGPVTVLRAFAPVLARNGGGAVVNVLSALSWLTSPLTGSYSASKAAAWSFTGSARAELRGQGTQVVGVHLGYMDTDMVAHLDVPKIAPEDVARQTLDAVEDGGEEVLADLPSERAKVALSGKPAGLEL
ncbi:SDR family oxidoreductase [Actinomycetospora endophytica]|uniref:SDR family oxidoreductase n=1 Tax=Actinomycetospora endophytica TaxID=2291215 RepID=A0ABS8P9S6_9PSEU|nr:SDR family oxidoreductase [Actinomycetospora endophytica]MCD2194677.1 SDR family oxidoreductase [Actinomycetospora endophytica]